MATYTGGSAPLPVASVPEAYQPKLLENTQQQRMAQLLTQQAMQGQPQGQMISGHYVAPSWSQNLAPVANQALAMYANYQADKGQLELAKAIREAQGEALSGYFKDLKGSPAVAEQPAVIPQGQTLRDDNGMLTYGSQAGVAGSPAIPANSFTANMRAATNDLLPSFVRENAMKEITKGPKWETVTQINKQTGDTENWRYDANSQDPRSTLQFIGVSKAAFTPSEVLHLNDQGIGTGQFGNPYGGGRSSTGGGSMPTVGGNMPVGGGQPFVGGNTTNPASKPVSSTNAPVDALVKTYGYDPFKPPPMPPMKSGANARSWNADLYKPLEGTPANTVTGATTYVDALGKYSDYVNGLSAKDLTNPQVRNRLNSLYATVKLTGKEANNLGVLNGGDERILEEVVPNYSNIMVTKNTVKKILDEQKDFGSSKIVATYRTAQKPVPENMRKYVVVPKIAEETATTGTPRQTGATARAILNNKPIEVRGNKWVYSDTGEEVK